MTLSKNSIHQSKIKLNINFDLPMYHKSVSTTQGDLYLAGGAFQQDNQETIYSKALYKFNEGKNKLERKADMLQNRICHAICYLEHFIYVIAGIGKNKKQEDEINKKEEIEYW